jgi:hypothetical protein
MRVAVALGRRNRIFEKAVGGWQLAALFYVLGR